MYYVVSSIDPIKRLTEHNLKKVKSTRNKAPWELKFYQKYPNIKLARQIEYKLKKLKRKDYLEKIIRDGYIKLK